MKATKRQVTRQSENCRREKRETNIERDRQTSINKKRRVNNATTRGDERVVSRFDLPTGHARRNIKRKGLGKIERKTETATERKREIGMASA